MSKQRPQTPPRSTRKSFHNQLLQSASWLGWGMSSPTAPSPVPHKAATPQPDVTSPLGLPAGSEPA